MKDTSRNLISQVFQIIIFLTIFFSLQSLWNLERESPFCHFIIETMTVKMAVVLINIITPSVSAIAQGIGINANGGGINVNNGCEGIEVMFLLVSAMLVSPLSWRAKIGGVMTGIVYVFVFNQVRLVVMFYAARTDKHLFTWVHGLIAPVVFIGLTGLFYAFWLSRSIKSSGFAVKK